MSLVYKSTFPASARGAGVNVVNQAGHVVDSGVISTIENGLAVFRTTQAEGNYSTEGTDTPWVGPLESVMTVDLAASIAAGGGGGGDSETAYFIGTATADTTGDQFDLAFVQDGRFPAVDWASVEGGTISLPGPVVVTQMLYRYGVTLDFTDATGFSTADTAPNSDATILFSRDGDGFDGNAGGPYVEVPTGTPGLVFAVDAAEQGIIMDNRCAANVELGIKGQINAFGYDASGDPITDGVVTGTVALAITRPTLPTIP